MAEEFQSVNSAKTRLALRAGARRRAHCFEPHVEFKRRVPQAIGLIRTGDTVQYANLIIESA